MFSPKGNYRAAYLFIAFFFMISLFTSAEGQTKSNRLSLATGGTGGVYYP